MLSSVVKLLYAIFSRKNAILGRWQILLKTILVCQMISLVDSFMELISLAESMCRMLSSLDSKCCYTNPYLKMIYLVDISTELLSSVDSMCRSINATISRLLNATVRRQQMPL